MATRVVIDCDPGHDDAIAILLALASTELDVLGITTVAGNQTLEKTTANAIRVLDHVGRADVAVAAGADRPLVREPFVASYVHGESGLEGPSLPPPSRDPLAAHAVDFLAAQIERGGVTLVAVGPLTNVALLLARHPAASAGLDRIVVMGGAIAEGNVTPAAEFNIWADPEAAARVFGSGLDVTMIGLDVTHRALVGPAHYERLRAAGRAGTLVADLLEYFNVFHRDTYGFSGSPIHDAVAVAHLLGGDLVTTVDRAVKIDCGGEPSRGRTYVDRWRRTDWPVNAHVAVEIDAGGFVELLLERVARLG